MQWPEAGTDPFPSPNRLEPESLRRDILDELADHLAQSAEDEMARAGLDEDKAWERALRRFGNPDALARRLWWDAMKERVMRDWIQTGLTIVSAVVVVMAAIFLAYSLRQMQTMQTAQMEFLKTMRDLGTGKPQEPTGLPLDVEVRRGIPNGPPAPGLEVRLSGKLEGDNTVEAVIETDAEGRARFYPVPQGSYSINISDPQSTMRLFLSHSLFAGAGSKLQILAPDSTAVDVRFATNPELPFRDEQVLSSASFSVVDQVGDFSWRREGTVFAGRAGVCVEAHGPDSEARTRGILVFRKAALGAPQDSIKLPPLHVAFRNIQPAFRFGHGEAQPKIALMEGICRDGGTSDVSVDLAPGESNTVTLPLSEEEVAVVEKVMKTYAVVTRWMHDSMSDLAYQHWSAFAAALGGYVVDAVPLKDAVVVEAPHSPPGKLDMSLTVKEGRQDGALTVAGGPTGGAVALRLPDLEELLRYHPNEYRLLLSCRSVTDANVTAWSGGEWTEQVGSGFTVSPGGSVTWARAEGSPQGDLMVADVTGILRGEDSKAVSGLLIQFTQGDGILLKGLGADNSWCLPHLLVVSNTPPTDL